MKNEALAAPSWQARLLACPELTAHPRHRPLIEVITGGSNLSSTGYPYIVGENHRLFIDQVPHLFQNGLAILDWLERLDGVLQIATDGPAEERVSLDRTRKVVRNMVLTAGITAPPDLWLLRQVLAVHIDLGILADFQTGAPLDPDTYARRHQLSSRRLAIAWHFLCSRGYLVQVPGGFCIENDAAVRATIAHAETLTAAYRSDMLPPLVDCLRGKSLSDSLRAWLHIDRRPAETANWIADTFQIELGYRLVPLVLALRVLGRTAALTSGVDPAVAVPDLLPEMIQLFEQAGMVRDGRVTRLGARVFERGPGPFGIIAAYHPYLSVLDALMAGRPVSSWVRRGENVAASQDANRKTFLKANDMLDLFCARYPFRYTVFIEHAVGKGEATRQRFDRSGDSIGYFGADLEDAAIDAAIEQQNRGLLPSRMNFIRSADIGIPERVIEAVAARNGVTRDAVMMVGNGFHEIREQTNDKMMKVFRAYARAGIVLIFTEESALGDDDLRQTAWNTYHAGFRFLHELSGQGLRPAVEGDTGSGRWSWRRCAESAGYLVLDDFSYHTRTIYPYKRPGLKNPSISVSYFCVPAELARRLGIGDGPGGQGSTSTAVV